MQGKRTDLSVPSYSKVSFPLSDGLAKGISLPEIHLRSTENEKPIPTPLSFRRHLHLQYDRKRQGESELMLCF